MVDQHDAIKNGELTSAVALTHLRDDLRRLRDHIGAFEAEMEPLVSAAAPSQVASARNLVDYLGLRQMDLRLPNCWDLSLMVAERALW
jgi:hypothetical protein